jgi:hypothetical protein
MVEEHPRFQFSLRRLLCWVFVLCVLLGLTTLPWPANAYLAPMFASLVAGYLGSRSVGMAAFAGAVGCTASLYLVIFVEANRRPARWQSYDVLVAPWLAGCCCLPVGAHLGLAMGVLARDQRSEQRLKTKLTSLLQEVREQREVDSKPPEKSKPDGEDAPSNE